jgi:YidC/Oxa1 family membrane protein insertase
MSKRSKDSIQENKRKSLRKQGKFAKKMQDMMEQAEQQKAKKII